MPEIRMICLANSRKSGGRCIAGIDYNTGEWIRPVNDGGGELSLRDINYEDGNTPKVLDIIDVPVLEYQPLYYQPENWVIDWNYYWTKVGELPVGELTDYCENELYIFGGSSDRVSEEQVKSITAPRSLILINVKEICLIKTWNYKNFPQLRAIFAYNGSKYNLVVTDKSLEEKFLDGEVEIGQYPYVGNLYLTISLGENFYGNHYKLLASVICLDRTKRKVLNIEP